MATSLEELLQLGEARRYLTFTDVNGYLPDDQVNPEILDALLGLLADRGIELVDESEVNERQRPKTQSDPALLKRFIPGPGLLAGWKSYPIRVPGQRLSDCHHQPMFLVGMAGGFVTANCSECGKNEWLLESEFLSLDLWVSCPRCKVRMLPEHVRRVKDNVPLAANYSYVCASCRFLCPPCGLVASLARSRIADTDSTTFRSRCLTSSFDVESLELAMSSINPLRSRLLEVAGMAREQHIDKQMEAYAASRAEVVAILEQLREAYKQDASPFNEEFLSDIRTAKVSARIITRADLDREAIARERRAIVAAHKAFLHRRGLLYRGTRLGLGQRRITHCYVCKDQLDNAVDVECVACGWIVCQCGACGCGYYS